MLVMDVWMDMTWGSVPIRRLTSVTDGQAGTGRGGQCDAAHV